MIVIASRERGACPTFQLEVLNTKSAEEDHEGAEEANSLLLPPPASQKARLHYRHAVNHCLLRDAVIVSLKLAVSSQRIPQNILNLL